MGTKQKLFLAVIFLVLAMVVAVKLYFFPAIRDAWFEMDDVSLQKVPAHLIIIRPTRFARSVYRRGVIYAWAGPNRDNPSRIMGRDVSLRDVIAAAYGENAGHVLLPPDAPTADFDFIVTADDPRPQLQKAIQRSLDYTAEHSTRNADVLALRVTNARLPGFTASAPGEKPMAFYQGGNFHLKHCQLKQLTRDFEDILKIPVVDKTGLTNYYDFALPWSPQIMTQLNNQTAARPTLDNILRGLGLGLEPDTASLEMLVVKKNK